MCHKYYYDQFADKGLTSIIFKMWGFEILKYFPKPQNRYSQDSYSMGTVDIKTSLTFKIYLVLQKIFNICNKSAN